MACLATSLGSDGHDPERASGPLGATAGKQDRVATTFVICKRRFVPHVLYTPAEKAYYDMGSPIGAPWLPLPNP